MIGKRILNVFVLVLFLGFAACSGARKGVTITNEEKDIFSAEVEDTVTIKAEDSNYEIVIIDPGFNRWLRSIAHPRGYYSQDFLETRNRIYVIEWNNRVIMPTIYDPLLYELQINYDPYTDYGYEVNYQLYNYFIYFQRKYKQRLGPFLPRI